jgi:hypothetical protein
MTKAHAPFSFLCLSFVLGSFVLLGGCTPARMGVFGNTMFSGGLPALAVTPARDSGLVPVASGRLLAGLETDTTQQAFAGVNYAVFGAIAPVDAKGATVTKHGHVLVTELSNSYAWEFNVESWPSRNEVYLRTVDFGGLDWTEHLLYADSTGDWFSELWRNNGFGVPERWIGKRWSRDYANHYRVVVEYREALPSCLDVANNEGQSYSVHAVFNADTPECRRELQEFEARAARAFEVQNLRDAEKIPEPGNSLRTAFTEMPERLPDMKKLVGTAQRSSRGGNDLDLHR